MQLRTILICTAGLLGCPVSSRTDGGMPGAQLQQQVLEQIDGVVVRPALAQFVLDAAAQRQAVERWAQATGLEEVSARSVARDRFEVAFLSWQRLEGLQFGPLGAATRVTAGQGLRDEIYSWPTVNLCRVETALVAGPTPGDAYFDTALVTSKGFAVLEALLFVEGTANSCPPNATINVDGSWAALAASPELGVRRRGWALAVSKHLERTAARAEQLWIAPGGFGDQLRAAGTMGSSWRTPKDALDDVFAGLFYVDQVVKDLKLAGPAAITPACMREACPELAESPHAKLSTRALVENLTSLRDAFTGRGGAGFDDLLAERGATELRNEMVLRLDAAVTEASALGAPVQTVAVSNHDALVSVQAQVKRFTDLLKSQFVSTLSLKVPKEGAGDND